MPEQGLKVPCLEAPLLQDWCLCLVLGEYAFFPGCGDDGQVPGRPERAYARQLYFQLQKSDFKLYYTRLKGYCTLLNY